MKKVLSDNNPKNLTQKQKNNRKKIYFDLLEQLNKQPGLLDNNLAPCDIYLFLKSTLKENLFSICEENEEQNDGSTETFNNNWSI